MIGDITLSLLKPNVLLLKLTFNYLNITFIHKMISLMIVKKKKKEKGWKQLLKLEHIRESLQENLVIYS